MLGLLERTHTLNSLQGLVPCICLLERPSGTFNCSLFSNNSFNMATPLLEQDICQIIYYSVET